jgi:hypothetical protein
MTLEAILKYPAVFLAGLLAALIVTPLWRRLAPRLGFLDRPGVRKIHQQVVPRGGGLALFLGFHAACAVVFLIPWAPFAGQLSIGWWFRFLPLSAGVVALGLLDDRFDLKPLTKLAGQIALAAAAYALGIRLQNILGFAMPGWVDLFATVFWFVALMNAFNLIDGLDGLATGIALIAATGIGLSLLFRGQPGDVLLFLALRRLPRGSCATTISRECLSGRHRQPVSRLHAGGAVDFDEFQGVVHGRHRRAAAGGGRAAVRHAAGGLAAVHAPAAPARGRRGAGAGNRAGRRRPSAPPAAAPGARAGAGGLAAVCRHVRARPRGAARQRVQRPRARDPGAGLPAGGLHRGAPPRRHRAARKRPGGAAGAVATRAPQPHADRLHRRRPAHSEWVLLAGRLLLDLQDGALDDPVKQFWLRTAPMDVVIPFVALLLFRSYSRVWYLARVSEYAATGLAVALGYAVACGVRLLGDAGTAAGWLLYYLLLAGLAAPAVVLSRAALRVVQDLMQWRSRGSGGSAGRALVCGAGYRTTLFLRQMAFRSRETAPVEIVGIVSEDAAITGHDVHGVRVLGTCSELPALIRLHRAEVLYLVEPVDEAGLAQLRRMLENIPVRVIRWDIVETEVPLAFHA